MNVLNGTRIAEIIALPMVNLFIIAMAIANGIIANARLDIAKYIVPYDPIMNKP